MSAVALYCVQCTYALPYLRVWYGLMQMKDTYGEDPVRASDGYVDRAAGRYVRGREREGGREREEGRGREGDANRLR